jgi:hypothetical protein
MIGNKAFNPGAEKQDDRYLSAILSILDEEMDLQAPCETTADESDELDLLVADLLKQIASEPDTR